VSHPAPSHFVWWLAGRSAGIVAFLLISISVTLGLAMAARVIPPRHKRTVVRLHEHVALTGLAAIAAHAVLLMADPWLNPGLKGIAVPFAMSYRPLWSGMGIVAAYLATILALSFYARRRLRPGVWRKMHRATVLVYGLGVAHTLGAGTDATTLAILAVLLASAGPILFLFLLRVLRGRASARTRGRRTQPGAAPAPGRDPAPARRPPARGARVSPSAPRAHVSRRLGTGDQTALLPRATEAGGM
jgi:methionine sulfoxide reductase heme-binding subunit